MVQEFVYLKPQNLLYPKERWVQLFLSLSTHHTDFYCHVAAPHYQSGMIYQLLSIHPVSVLPFHDIAINGVVFVGLCVIIPLLNR